MLALSIPSMRAAVPPARSTPLKPAAPRSKSMRGSSQRRRRAGRVGECPTNSVCASCSGPATSTRPSTAPACPTLPVDGGPDLVVLPEAFARDFGDPSEPLGSYAEALDGPFAQAIVGAGRRVGRHRRGRHVRGERRPGATLQHAARPWRCGGELPQDPPLRLVRLPRVRPAERRRPRAPVGRGRGHEGRPDDLLRPALPRARPAAGRRRRRGAGGPGRVGRRRPEGRPLAHPRAGPGDREHRPRRRGRPARSALLRPLDGGRPARRRPGRSGAGRGDRRCGHRPFEVLAAARRTNPSLANRRL